MREGGVCAEVVGYAGLFPGGSQSASLPSKKRESTRALGDSQQIVPIHASILHRLLVLADATRVRELAALGVALWVEEVVAFGAKVERGLGAIVVS
jgi:hypothetical protein